MKRRLNSLLSILIILSFIIGTILIFRPYLIERLQIVRTAILVENFEKGITTVTDNSIVSILLKILGEYEGSGYDSFEEDEFLIDEGLNKNLNKNLNENLNICSHLIDFIIPPAFADGTENISIIGKVEIPAFGELGINVLMNNTSTQALKLGVCHLEGSSLPGQLGNCIILGHRTSNQFYHVNNLIEKENYDKRVIITDSYGYTYIYEASSYRSCPLKELWTTINEHKLFDYQLTLLTCSPKTPPEGQRRTNRLLIFCNLIKTIPPSTEVISEE